MPSDSWAKVSPIVIARFHLLLILTRPPCTLDAMLGVKRIVEMVKANPDLLGGKSLPVLFFWRVSLSDLATPPVFSRDVLDD